MGCVVCVGMMTVTKNMLRKTSRTGVSRSSVTLHAQSSHSMKLMLIKSHHLLSKKCSAKFGLVETAMSSKAVICKSMVSKFVVVSH